MLKKLSKQEQLPKIRTEVVLVTPEIAEAWLSKNDRNRNLSRTTVSTYARDIKAGRWQLNNDAIAFGPQGLLLNGQHRLNACIEAATAFPSLVVYAMPEDAQDVMDGGRLRRTPDVMAINGITNATLRTAALRIMHAIKMDVRNVLHHKASTSEILALHERHPGVVRSIGAVTHRAVHGGARPAILVATHYIGGNLIKGGEELADEFIAVFSSGVPAYKGCPAHSAREKIMRAKLQKTPLLPAAQWALVVHAWNLFRQRRSVTYLKKTDDTVTFDDLDLRKL